MRLDDITPDDPRLSGDVLPVLRELRPHLTADSLRTIYADGHPQGLRFLAAFDATACVGVAGWRIVHNTSAGRKLYVDDLVTDPGRRSSGVGRALLAELEARARTAGCSCIDLDSGVQRADAHRFYFRERMDIAGFHFRKAIG
ncbi:MAG: GNAT family N-acetyltransferase [Actinomycetota bacterium]|nr:GNAT family N-acetyltransferase [Actinomycetota bacterium]